MAKPTGRKKKAARSPRNPPIPPTPDQTPTGGRNAGLSTARLAKNDEFYTQWVDIEREMNAYLEYDPNVFRDKVILLPCDDPEWSNFTKFFALHFRDYGIKKLISTSYAPNSKPSAIPYQLTLFEKDAPQFDESRTRTNGKKFILEAKDINEDGVINIEDLQWEYLEGDGDFRSDEVTELRNNADIVVTNPPFSLFREFVLWVTEAEKKFVMIGNKNAITYKEVFPLIMRNQLWLGSTPMSLDMLFKVPDAIARDLELNSKEGSKWRRVDGQVLARASSVWFTNIDHGRRHEPLALMTVTDNIKHSKHDVVKGVGYHRYENYDAIEVPYTDAIPSDFAGVMGVPISFLGRYSPDQFEIVGNGQTMADELGIRPVGQDFVDAYYKQGNKGQINAKWNNLVYRIGDKVVVPYQRILIKHKSR